MNTPAHLIFGAAAFGCDRKTTWAALIGALLPDLSLYLMASYALFIAQIPDHIVFGELYYSNLWQNIFAIDNSVLLWGAGLGAALWLNSRAMTAFFGSGLLHIATDFMLHHDDGRRHFWPITDWVFESPFSYWDSGHHAGWIGPIIAGICTILTVILWRRLQNWGWRITFAILLFMELYTLRGWFLYF